MVEALQKLWQVILAKGFAVKSLQEDTDLACSKFVELNRELQRVLERLQTTQPNTRNPLKE